MKTSAPLPLGTSDFTALRKFGQIYVDKTGMVHRLASQRQKFFLSRPRHFGKTLLLSTFESLFQYGLTHFDGLYIEPLWNEPLGYQVIRLSFSHLQGISSAEEFHKLFNLYFLDILTINGFSSPIKTKTEGLVDFISWLAAQRDNSVVLLLDDCDRALSSYMNEPELYDFVKTEFSRLFSAFNDWDRKIRFLFMTSMADFNLHEIFSGLNHIIDISEMPEYAFLLGFSREEVERYFSDYLEQASICLDLKKEALIGERTSKYGRYCFGNSGIQPVFSPWQLFKFLNFPANGFDNY